MEDRAKISTVDQLACAMHVLSLFRLAILALECYFSLTKSLESVTSPTFHEIGLGMKQNKVTPQERCCTLHSRTSIVVRTILTSESSRKVVALDETQEST